MRDVVIIGARCAGSALGLMLARDHLDVTIVDRSTFPSDTLSGHYIHSAGVSCLNRLGLGPALADLGAPAQTEVSVDFGPVVLTGQPEAGPDGNTTAYAPRRYIFDPMLAEHAVSAGAELRQGVSFSEPLIEDGRVVGIRTQLASGKTEDIRARVVIGADGARSRLAKTVGAERYDVRAAETCFYYGYWSGVDLTHPRLFIRDGLFAVAAPTNDGLTFIGVAWPKALYSDVRKDVDRSYHRAVATIPWLADRLASAKQVGRYAGGALLDGFYRTASGAGWALLGDAGYHKDPITAQGMTDAFLHGERLARAIARGLSWGSNLDAELRQFGRERDAMSRAMYGLTCDLSRLAPPPPDAMALIGALKDNPAQTRRYLGVIAGTVGVEEFFDPENLANILDQTVAA